VALTPLKCGSEPLPTPCSARRREGLCVEKVVHVLNLDGPHEEVLGFLASADERAGRRDHVVHLTRAGLLLWTGASTRTLLRSTSAVFVTETTTQSRLQKVLTSSRKVDECTHLVRGRDGGAERRSNKDSVMVREGWPT